MKKLLYYTAWRNPRVHLVGGMGDDLTVYMRNIGPGRESIPEERVWEARFTKPLRDGIYISSGDQMDPEADGELYHPTLSHLYLADGEFHTTEPQSRGRAPHYDDHEVHCETLRHTFRVHVMLPRNYRRAAGPYPVAFLNDGQNQWEGQGFFGGWHTNTTALSETMAGRLPDIVLVSVESDGISRNRAYRPAPLGKAHLYVDFLADVLFPYCAERYAISDKPADIAIIGSSYGANCSVFAGLHRPDRFGLIGSMSFASLPHRPIIRAIRKLQTPPFARIYVDTGTRWSQDEDNDQSDFTPTTKVLIDLLQKKGLVQNDRLWGRICQGHCHWELDWRQRIGPCLSFLFYR